MASVLSEYVWEANHWCQDSWCLQLSPEIDHYLSHLCHNDHKIYLTIIFILDESRIQSLQLEFIEDMQKLDFYLNVL